MTPRDETQRGADPDKLTQLQGTGSPLSPVIVFLALLILLVVLLKLA